MERGKPVVGITGPCASGKSTLAAGLKQAGYPTRHIAQEHSDIPDMWAKLAHPDVLVFLDISQEAADARRTKSMRPGWLDDQQKRLRHARDHADLYINTDQQTPEQVLQSVLNFLRQ